VRRADDSPNPNCIHICARIPYPTRRRPVCSC
jgi:hypothetical protein